MTSASPFYAIYYKHGSWFSGIQVQTIPVSVADDIEFGDHWFLVKNLVGRVIFAIPKERIVAVSGILDCPNSVPVENDALQSHDK